MEKHYHILNGDALKEQFPKELEGEIIVTRECLVDGSVNHKNLDEFFQARAKFITDVYGDHSVEAYFADTVSEFDRIRAIPSNSMIHLWFEDDLFCQVNFWFVSTLIYNHVDDCKVFLIRPRVHTQFGFGGLNQHELVQIFEDRVSLTELDKISKLWTSYQHNDTESLISTTNDLQQTLPFILPAVHAHIDRIPTENNPGRPIQSLIEIINELGTDEFNLVFREFNKREAIYGFGDLQVKRLLDIINNS